MACGQGRLGTIAIVAEPSSARADGQNFIYVAGYASCTPNGHVSRSIEAACGSFCRSNGSSW